MSGSFYFGWEEKVRNSFLLRKKNSQVLGTLCAQVIELHEKKLTFMEKMFM